MQFLVGFARVLDRLRNFRVHKFSITPAQRYTATLSAPFTSSAGSELGVALQHCFRAERVTNRCGHCVKECPRRALFTTFRHHRHEGSIPFTRSIHYQLFTYQCSKSAVRISEDQIFLRTGSSGRMKPLRNLVRAKLVQLAFQSLERLSVPWFFAACAAYLCRREITSQMLEVDLCETQWHPGRLWPMRGWSLLQMGAR